MTLAIEWVLGLGIMFGFAFFLNHITFDDMIGFLAYLTMFNGFVVWCELLPLWTLVLNCIVLVLVMYISMKNEGV